MKITQDSWDTLSSLLVKRTREFNDHTNWRGFTTSYWRMNSDDLLREILEHLAIGIEKEEE
jgi:hypothetical protein